MHGTPWKADTMAIKFPSPKSTFQAFKSAFGAKPTPRAQTGGTGPSARTSQPSELPRRNAPPSARNAPPPPRQASPRRPGGAAEFTRARHASPGTPPHAETPGDKLLGLFKLHEIDTMDHHQLAQVVAFMAGRQAEEGAAAKLAQLAVPFMHNWKRLREEFDDAKLTTAIRTHHMAVLEVLMRPATSGEPPKPKPADAPTSGPGTRHQWNQTPPRTSSARAEPARAKPSSPPVSVIGLGRDKAVAELKARGVTPAELKAMSQAFSNYANFGGDQPAADFKKAYGHLVADDITDSANRARLALFFKGLAREGNGT